MAKKVLLKVSSGDPNKPQITQDQSTTDLDVRDAIANLLATNNVLDPADKASIYGRLDNIIGEAKARKLMTHAYIFNSRPEMAKMPIEEKIRSFYSVGSNDPEVNAILNKTKSLGYGAIPGFRQSSNSLNQQISNQIPSNTTGTILDPEVQRKIMLKINNKE